MKNLTEREKNIVLATIHLWNVNAKSGGYVPDYELLNPSFDLPMEARRDIRDLVQEPVRETKGGCPACGLGEHGKDALCPYHMSEYLGQHLGSHNDVSGYDGTRYTPIPVVERKNDEHGE
jgi:hypothetical protein